MSTEPIHPWRFARDHFPRVTIDNSHVLPDGQSGAYDEETNTIYLCKTLLQDERRCALRHELFHVLRGAPSVEDDWLEQKEERIVDRLAARSLIRSSDFVDALVWCGNRVGPECAAELWVDIDTLLTWVRTLTPKEVDEIEAELARRA